jgi:hypothetical protein
MSNIKKENPQLSLLLEDKFFRLTMGEIKACSEEIVRLINSGVQALVLCVNGSQRSPDATIDLADEGIACLYLDGGLRALSLLTEDQLQKAAEFLANFPYIFTIDLSERELNTYHKVIDTLNLYRAMPPIMAVPTFAQIIKMVG